MEVKIIWSNGDVEDIDIEDLDIYEALREKGDFDEILCVSWDSKNTIHNLRHARKIEVKK